MAKSGAGIAWLPRTLAMRDLENGDLFALGGPDLQIPVEIRLFRPAVRQSPAAEVLWEAL
jgi:DNA-binding transcriptional LysR family regulator